jgi:hypothetical protein
MIQSDPPIRRMTIRTPKASASTLLALSAVVVICRKNTRCPPSARSPARQGRPGCSVAPQDWFLGQRTRSPSAGWRVPTRSDTPPSARWSPEAMDRFIGRLRTDPVIKDIHRGSGISSPDQTIEPGITTPRCGHAVTPGGPDRIVTDRRQQATKSRERFALLEFRNLRHGYARRRQRSHPGSVAHSAGIDRHIVHSTGVCRALRNAADWHIARCRRSCASRKLREGSGRGGQGYENCESYFCRGVRHGEAPL